MSEHDSNKGFTIIELLIATTVMSVIILLVTVMITSIGNIYYKGINQSHLEDNLRNVSNEISSRLQVNDLPITPGSYTYATGSPLFNVTMKAYCINGVRYSYAVGYQIGTQSGQLDHVLYRDDWSGNCIPVRLDKPNPENGVHAGASGTNGVELMSPDSLLTAFTITSPSPYTLTIGMAFATYNAGGPGVYLNLTGSHAGVNATCKSGNGDDDFCATASVITTVVQRIN